MAYPQTFTDQLSRQILLAKAPQRIISLVPSQTELLFDLGLADKIVGVTKFCVHPANLVKEKVKIGGTKNFNFEIIRDLKPDLIIGNKEENYPEGIQALAQDYPVWVSDIFMLADALAMMENIALLTETSEAAAKIIQNIKEGFAQLKPGPFIPAAYFIWRNPYMSVGHNTFIHEMMAAAGFQNIFGSLNRYPIITPDDLQSASPKVVFLSSEPYPFKEKHLREIQEILPQALVTLVDGELFSWYGSRLQQTPPFLQYLRKELEASLLN
ncbi:helical backbone metal receptor [Adhaeribacter rhizoryzae]|uniref:ABC transporter substrate-binding protein n=1 Tax=Adhaeribacter rhizoryzae TaxID=2607907 RepID=A0A5M6DGX0_9BACT|nr:helical backbone metal receptor [Adhaeribacter rhizoryzae]KAA5546663.1 ABC transporter substrate-binding protein [Adhaeribacter rhizoryzae]